MENLRDSQCLLSDHTLSPLARLLDRDTVYTIFSPLFFFFLSSFLPFSLRSIPIFSFVSFQFLFHWLVLLFCCFFLSLFPPFSVFFGFVPFFIIHRRGSSCRSVFPRQQCISWPSYVSPSTAVSLRLSVEISQRTPPLLLPLTRNTGGRRGDPNFN